MPTSKRPEPNVPSRETTPSPTFHAGERRERLAARREERRAARLLAPTLFLDPPPPLGEDTMWRGLLRDGEMRILVARTTAAVGEAAARLGCSADSGRLVAELVTGALLVRSTINPEERLQLFVQGDGAAGQLVCDVWAEGGMRASLQRAEATVADHGPLIGHGTAQFVRHGRRGGTYRSTMAVAGDESDELLMRYLLESEQILSLIHIDVAMDGPRVAAAVGYLVQVMPHGEHRDLRRLVANLKGLEPLRRGMTGDDPDGRAWAARLLDGFRWDQCARESVAFQCRCSRERMMAMLMTLQREELALMATEGEGVDTVCDYCRTTWRISAPELAQMAERPS